MKLTIDGLAEKDFSGFSFSVSNKKVDTSKTTVKYTKNRRKVVSKVFVKKLKCLTIKIFFADSDTISFEKTLTEAKINIK